MDQMVRNDSYKRQTCRWTMAMWYNVVDVACLNAYILFTAKHPKFHHGVSYKRRLFLRELVLELVLPHMKNRAEGTPWLLKNITAAMEIIGVSQQAGSTCGQDQGPPKKKRCFCCPCSKDHKSRTTCDKCAERVCKEHSRVVCVKCFR